ncbi:PKD domain-containing protein, partial [candidate division KSB1 bacterium]|nr:PKD domain-containing protein [candidate division KSB1 bacterium]
SPPPPVIANFTADPTEGISPLEVTFTNTSENATQARWDFGDDSCSEEWSPIHTYTNPPLKHYTVTLIVWNDQGDSDTLTCTNLIKIFRPAHSDFNAMSIAGRPDDDVQFINHCGGLVNSFTWDYGDGIQEIFRSDVRYAVHPIHTYQDSGSYEVTLTASGQGGSDTLSLEDYIFIHDDYCELQLIDSSETEAGFGWSNVIDHDVLSDRSSMRAPNSLDVLATFMFADSSVKKLHTVRFKCNDAHKRQPQNNLARRFEVLTSEDGDHFRRCVAGYLNENERWETYRFEPVTTKYIKLNFRSARKRKSPYITMCEFQVCASPLPPERETIELVNISGREAKGDLLHKDFRMFQNYPNPFNPTTTINCYLPDEGVAELKIYDIRGSIVYSLSQTVDSAGLHAFKWTGSDHNGQPVRSGIYIYRLIFNTQDGTTYSDSGRMVLLK